MATTGGITTDYEVSGQDGRGIMAPMHPMTLEPADDHDVKDMKIDVNAFVEEEDDDDTQEGEKPTEEERTSLRLVAGKIPFTAYVICLVEFAERASYYGCSGIFNNFIQRPLPKGSSGGETLPGSQDTPGALGLGLQASTGLTKTFTFLAYVLPILGGIVADTKWGRFKTICIGTAIGVIAHVLLVIAALPAVIATGNAVAPFVISILVLAFATGFIKPCIAPILADQSPIRHQRVITLPSGERVIVDPSTTVATLLAWYYWSVNIGAVFQISTSYCAKIVGYWLAWLVPGIIYMLMPICLWWVRKRLILVAPQGSVVLDACKVTKISFTKGGVKHFIKGDQEKLWDKAKPSKMAEYGVTPKKAVLWDDDFVDELKRAVKACKLFLFFPIFLMADGGIDTMIGSQGGSMITNGAPNDLLQNFNSITIIFAVPLLNVVIYPWLRKMRIPFTPIRRIIFGFGLCVLQMVICAVLQWRVYETSPCGYYATECLDDEGNARVSTLSIWTQIPLYVLPALAEVFINITSYEIAITRAPQRMKGLVFAICLSMSSLSSALALIITPAFKDPHLHWIPVGVAVANVIAMVFIWIYFRHMDNETELLEIGVDRKLDFEDNGKAPPDYEQQQAKQI